MAGLRPFPGSVWFTKLSVSGVCSRREAFSFYLAEFEQQKKLNCDEKREEKTQTFRKRHQALKESTLSCTPSQLSCER